MTQPSNPPLTARSVLASALLGEGSFGLTVSKLVHLGDLFGINENRARVALSRMVSAGEASTDGAGRYRLAGHLLERQSRQEASRAGRTRPWDGSWWIVVVTTSGSTAEIRNRRRRELALARLAELREGVWVRPDNVERLLTEEIGGDVVEFVGSAAMGSAAGFGGVGRAGGAGVPASELWPLGQWAARALVLLGALDESAPSGPEDLAPGFELSAAVLRHFQADPLLPEELLPSDWPGVRLRRTYDKWDARYRAVLAEWSRST